ncbi:alpha/beta hydrolase [Streptosporangium saharense]|uniref:alpha/beta hydrolase n=1 Tax=Streptosporangium saharense TaxID=1706840 RepID=UPI00367F178E
MEAALSRVVRLGADHASMLDACARCMAAHAWVGGGAPKFNEALATRRTALQAAFTEAAQEIAQRIRRLGGQAHVPSFSTSISVMAPVPGAFSGMDIAAMTRMVADLQRAGQDLPSAGQRLGAELSALCVSSPSVRQVLDTGAWADEQARDLRQRLTTIQQTHDVGTASKATAAFGLFGGHAPASGEINRLTAAAGKGDVTALKTLKDLQDTGEDATLAGRLTVWWRKLDKTAQDQLIATSPGLLGALNGLPATVRDQANRKHLADQKATISQDLAKLRTSLAELRETRRKLTGGSNVIRDPRGFSSLPPLKEQQLTKSIEDLELRSRQIASVEKSLALGGQHGRPPALLLQLELGGLGKIAVSFGNPDEADNLAIYVPGTGTKLEGFGNVESDAERAALTWDKASFHAPDKKVASIAWFGYDAPQWGATVSLDGTVANMNAATKGAPFLASFTDGLQAAHKGSPNVRLSVLGHSYGSTVVGLAAQQRFGKFADQLIFVGSPGVGAGNAKDLGVESVWVGESPNDPVGDLGSFPFVPIRSSDGLKWGSPLGVDPSGSGFGARHFPVQESGSNYDFAAHSSYWDSNSVSLENISYLIDGQYKRFYEHPAVSTESSSTEPQAMSAEKSPPHPQSSPNPDGG